MEKMNPSWSCGGAVRGRPPAPIDEVFEVLDDEPSLAADEHDGQSPSAYEMMNVPFARAEDASGGTAGDQVDSDLGLA